MSGATDLLEDRIGHRFADKGLLERALTHPSCLQDDPLLAESNQRLEFLGDAVLQFILTEALFSLFPAEREGELSARRAALSRGAFLAELALEVGVDTGLKLGQSEEANGGRRRAAALEDAFEALVGAVFLDAGIEAARAAVLRIYGDLHARLLSQQHDANPKGRLQEAVQSLHGNGAVRYELLQTQGADHERIYEVGVFVHDKAMGKGRGSSKKLAEEEAARAALLAMQPPSGTL